MKEDVLSLLLESEEEYFRAVKDAESDAGEYVNGRRKEQSVFIGELKQETYLYEKSESEKLERALSEEYERMEKEADRLKKRMKTRQREKADWISELLKEEVLSLLWR